ncbi:hypothetical protein IMCC3317_16860 [Kordia antarctica]|uniref:Uncharacterized protein n=1 Tax=Kordia antarctica TaxID=1218801 RepID=A0A7L4ZK84_9FLAO|nr:hypothetical protein [Kordia antarctica]QHI36324.1 hypothetical protein IMCC3317_16860 [Kordia antarctica]
MKTKNLNNLSLNKKSIATFTLTGGRAQPITNVTNITCVGICENSKIICDQE